MVIAHQHALAGLTVAVALFGSRPKSGQPVEGFWAINLEKAAEGETVACDYHNDACGTDWLQRQSTRVDGRWSMVNGEQ